MSGEKLSLDRFLENFSYNKYRNNFKLTREDVVKLVKSPVTKELLKEEDYKVLEKLQDEDTFRSVSNFEGGIGNVISIGEEQIKEKIATTAERAVESLFHNFGSIRDGRDENLADPWEFSKYDPKISEDEVQLLSDHVSGKITLDELITKCKSKGFKNTKELENSGWHSEAATVFKNIAMLKPEVKGKVVDILDSVKTFLGNFDSNGDGKTSIRELFKAGNNDKEAGISLKDVAIQVKKPN